VKAKSVRPKTMPKKSRSAEPTPSTRVISDILGRMTLVNLTILSSWMLTHTAV
jgi:hypothetical protein